MYLQICTSRKRKESSPTRPKAVSLHHEIQTVTRLMPQYEEHVGCRTTINDLPKVILDYIVSFLSLRDLANMRASFKAWRNLLYTTPLVKLDITQAHDTIFGFQQLGIKDEVPSLRCGLRLSEKPHNDMLTSLCNVYFLKLYINFSDFEMQFIASFLGRFSNLKFLSIHQSSWNDFIHFPQSNVSDLYWTSQNLAIIDHLEVAEISLCPGDNALAFLMYLVKNGKDLKYLVIRYSSRFWDQCKLEKISDYVKKEKASSKLRLCYRFESNPLKYEEVNEHHRKYACLLTKKEKRMISAQKRRQRHDAEIEEFRVNCIGMDIPSQIPAEFFDLSLSTPLPGDSDDSWDDKFGDY